MAIFEVLGLVLPDALHQVVSEADVEIQRPASHDVNRERLCFCTHANAGPSTALAAARFARDDRRGAIHRLNADPSTSPHLLSAPLGMTSVVGFRIDPK